MGKLDDLTEVFNGEVAELRIRQNELAGNISDINSTLSRLTEAIGRIEANQRPDSNNRNNTATTSADVREVRNSFPAEPGGTGNVGYRGINNGLESRNNMLKKVELPAFSGSQPYTWINQAERFFRLGNYNDEERLDLSSIRLQGPALNWFTCEIAKEPFRDWLQFKRRMIARFALVKNHFQPTVTPKKESVLGIVHATSLSCAVESTTSLEVEASGMCVKATMQVAKQIKAPIVEELQNKPRDGVSREMKTCGFNALTSSEKRNLITSRSVNEIGVEENVEMSQIWTSMSKMDDAHKLLEIMSHQTEKSTKKKQLKCFKSWRFKFKQRRFKFKKQSKIHVLLTGEMVEWAKKSVAMFGDIIAHYLFDQLVLGICGKKKQQRYPKTWKFKYKQKHSLRVLPQNAKHEHMWKFRVFKNREEDINEAEAKAEIQAVLESVLQEHNVYEAYALNLLLFQSENVAQRVHFSVWHCWKHKQLQQELAVWERDLTLLLVHIHMRNQLKLSQELHIKGIIVFRSWYYVCRLLHGNSDCRATTAATCWKWVTDFTLQSISYLVIQKIGVDLEDPRYSLGVEFWNTQKVFQTGDMVDLAQESVDVDGDINEQRELMRIKKIMCKMKPLITRLRKSCTSHC